MPSPSDATSPGTSAMMFRATKPTWWGRRREEDGRGEREIKEGRGKEGERTMGQLGIIGALREAVSYTSKTRHTVWVP